MAAEKLTRGRFAQIIIMLSMLIAVFIWRTVEHNSTMNITCDVNEKCTFFIDDSLFKIEISSENTKVTTQENNWILIPAAGSKELESSKNSWVFNVIPKSTEISFKLIQENQNIEQYVTIKQR